MPPRDVDGATLFAARNGRELREFLFVDTEQAYQAADLALLSRHLVPRTRSTRTSTPARRLFMIAMADGSLASIAIYRTRRHRRLEPAGDRRQRALGRQRGRRDPTCWSSARAASSSSGSTTS